MPSRNQKSDLIVRAARKKDLPSIVRIVNAGGPDGRPREKLPQSLSYYYFKAFEKIRADKNAHLMVVERDGKVIGTFQVNFLTYLAGKGRQDAHIEAFHIDKPFRGKGIGTRMMQWIILEAKQRDCRRIQLTTNIKRLRAHRFYRRQGFSQTHIGMKLVFK